MRGGLYSAKTSTSPARWASTSSPATSCAPPRRTSTRQRVRQRVGQAPAFLSFDIDVIDPAFAPGTGTPEIAGLLPHEAQAFLRSLAGMSFAGFDIVEVSPIYDGPGQITAVLAANIAFELLSLRALADHTNMTIIDINNWQDPNNTWWGYRHIRELIPTARIARAATPCPLPERLRDGLAAERVLEDPTTDGVLVLHDGHVVLERYARGMRPDDVHLMQSVSKSITGTLAGIIVDNGALAPDDLVTADVPELAGSSFDGATVRDLLDMRAGTRFDETYDDPQSDIRASEAQFRWAPGTPPAADAIAYLRTLRNHREHGGRFEYRSILTDVLGLVLHRAAGTPFAELIGTHLWGPIGAETDAQVTVDGAGFAVADGGSASASATSRASAARADGGPRPGLDRRHPRGRPRLRGRVRPGRARRRDARRPLPQPVVGPRGRRRPGRRRHPRPVLHGRPPGEDRPRRAVDVADVAGRDAAGAGPRRLRGDRAAARLAVRHHR